MKVNRRKKRMMKFRKTEKGRETQTDRQKRRISCCRQKQGKKLTNIQRKKEKTYKERKSKQKTRLVLTGFKNAVTPSL